jgi:hypothetical protein
VFRRATAVKKVPGKATASQGAEPYLDDVLCANTVILARSIVMNEGVALDATFEYRDGSESSGKKIAPVPQAS